MGRVSNNRKVIFRYYLTGTFNVPVRTCEYVDGVVIPMGVNLRHASPALIFIGLAVSCSLELQASEPRFVLTGALRCK